MYQVTPPPAVTALIELLAAAESHEAPSAEALSAARKAVEAEGVSHRDYIAEYGLGPCDPGCTLCRYSPI